MSELWIEIFYPELEEKLHYSHQRDAQSRDELARLLKAENVRSFDWEKLERLIKGSTTFIFGAGPSLIDDIVGLFPVISRSSFPIIAADGAIDALAKAAIFPQVLVSDLDSASEEMLVAQSKQRVLFIHAHGDNLDLIRLLVPKLGDKIFGTTQVKSTELVKNFGGLTDGDRSCYLASAFNPRTIVLAGMDFGSREGEYSKSRGDPIRQSQDARKIKLDIGLKSLEFLIANSPSIRFLNATSKGEQIQGAPRMNYEELLKELS